MGWEWLSGLIGPVVNIVANTTASQKLYLEWRMSDEGRKFYSRQEENAFWKALANGDTTVLDAAVADKQKRIDDLRHRTGIGVVLLMCFGLSLSGCRTYSIPDSIPSISRDALTSNEVTYAVNDMQVKTPEGKTQKLYGMWHIVSPDFVKMHVRNQDDLIKSLEELQKQQGVNSTLKVLALTFGIIVLILTASLVVERLRNK